ncbi:uncharacterized protein K460DRAFT_355734 [Cucurbitaria berberidis CBS 394.84]|uniref:Uncharacterized protein n=1 Tax=Cucurbitaria berberidis CBS 394.84 TaxID=1168544 RepID=A0A9P4GIB8_9PLEO|nr:uncharacterized protein K460DRAFT_355734 [Cucurbitaria berberidis CBS 394.84]KAF1845999.1 hypothetical protein K460DRAFT_355734 [Cucurbitaria berberidis CBS 394.84]
MDDEVIFIRATTTGKREAAEYANPPPARPAQPSDVPTERQERYLAREKSKTTEGYIARLDDALKRKQRGLQSNDSSLQGQVAMLKAQIANQEESSRVEIKSLREHNAKLEYNATAHNDKTRALEAKILSLTEEVREQKSLHKAGSSDDARILKRRIKLSIERAERQKQQIKDLVKETDTLSRKVEKLKAERQTTRPEQGNTAVLDQSDQIKTLQAHAARLKQKLRERGDHLIRLSRDNISRTELRREKKAALEATKSLRTHVAGMFIHYRALSEKNAVLLEKLSGMAEAGGFGDPGSLYRKELDRLKGQPIEELYEYKSRV